MSEQTYFNEGNVSVTIARFVVSGQTYAMNGVTSVRELSHPPSRKWPIIMCLIGILGLAVGGSEGLIPAIVWLGVGIFWLVRQKSKYTVLLSSASGESEALTSKDEGFITRIVEALNEAIIARG